jgi:glycerophosphoryl diester phosphodiesterase
VNDSRALRRALALGVDAITTDRPDRLVRLLASLGARSVE